MRRIIPVIWTRFCIGCLGLALLPACTTTYSRHGFTTEQSDPSYIEPGQERPVVLAEFGSPSTTGLVDDDIWIYHSYAFRNTAFFRPRLTERVLVLVKFDGTDAVSDVLTYDVDDGVVVKFASLETPTPGRRRTLLQQLFGSLGVTIPPSDVGPGGQGGPGGPGGPGPR